MYVTVGGYVVTVIGGLISDPTQRFGDQERNGDTK